MNWILIRLLPSLFLLKTDGNIIMVFYFSLVNLLNIKFEITQADKIFMLIEKRKINRDGGGFMNIDNAKRRGTS
jgi:hypothetical protein